MPVRLLVEEALHGKDLHMATLMEEESYYYRWPHPSTHGIVGSGCYGWGWGCCRRAVAATEGVGAGGLAVPAASGCGGCCRRRCTLCLPCCCRALGLPHRRRALRLHGARSGAYVLVLFIEIRKFQQKSLIYIGKKEEGIRVERRVHVEHTLDLISLKGAGVLVLFDFDSGSNSLSQHGATVFSEERGSRGGGVRPRVETAHPGQLHVCRFLDLNGGAPCRTGTAAELRAGR